MAIPRYIGGFLGLCMSNLLCRRIYTTIENTFVLPFSLNILDGEESPRKKDEDKDKKSE
jgi:hypothetical protein